MKKTIIVPFIIFLFIYSVSVGQTGHRDKFLHVIEKLFPHHEIDMVRNNEVIYTEVWDKHAAIPVYYDDIAELEDGIHVLAFTIYLSDNPNDYRIMKEKELITLEDINEDSEFTGGDQQLIQIVFYDFKNDKFLGKPQGFPISGIAWLPEEFNIPLEITYVESLRTYAECKNTCVLTIAEYSDMYPVKLYYVFKYHNNEILNSGPLRGSILGIYEKKNMIFGVFEEYNDTGETEEYEEVIMSF